MTTFDLDAFIANVNSDRSQSGSKKDRLNKVLMNTKDNQGINTFIPIISEKANNIYMKLQRVYEYFGTTSLIDNGEAWYRILPLAMYGGLVGEDLDLYNEVKGYLDTLQDYDDVDRDEFRVRNYALFFGINMSLKSMSTNKDIDTYKECPCMFVYPSVNVIDQLGTAINAKCDAMKGQKEWLSYVITPKDSGRQGVMQISYVKSSGVGYDATVNFELNSAFNNIIDPELKISEETMALFNDPIPTFLGWIYDNDNKSYFNKRAFTELRNQLKDRVNSMFEKMKSKGDKGNQPTYENKNNLTPSVPSEASADNKPKVTAGPPF